MVDPDTVDTAEIAAASFGKPAGPELLRQFDAGPWNRECAEAGIDLRIAASMLGKTKNELIEVVRKLGEAVFYEEMDRLAARQEWLSNLVKMLGTLESRLIIAGANVVVEGRDEPMRGFGPIL